MKPEQIAEQLVEIGALQLSPKDPFTWTSGIKSPIYCDNRMTMSFPTVRTMIVEAFVKKIKEDYSEIEAVSGCATAGIPHAAWIAERLDLPMTYVRGSAKKHGKQNQIEGQIKPGQKVLVVEDLISTGKSSIAAAQAIEEAGAEVIGVLAIFTYGLASTTEAFEKSGFKFETLTNFDTLVKIMDVNGNITTEDKAILREWQKDLEAHLA